METQILCEATHWRPTLYVPELGLELPARSPFHDASLLSPGLQKARSWQLGMQPKDELVLCTAWKPHKHTPGLAS